MPQISCQVLPASIGLKSGEYGDKYSITCDRHCGSKTALWQHLHDSPLHAPFFDCDDCDRSSDSEEALCETCDRSFGNKEALK